MSYDAKHDQGSGGHGHGHVASLFDYIKIFGALLVLTVITVGVSYAGLGKASIYVAMGVAVVKAFLVAAFFMHLKYDEKFNVLVFVSALLFLSIFFVIVATDLGYRGDVNPEEDTFVLQHEDAAKAKEQKRLDAEAKLHPPVVPARPGQPPVQPGAQPATAQPAPSAPSPSPAPTDSPGLPRR